MVGGIAFLKGYHHSAGSLMGDLSSLINDCIQLMTHVTPSGLDVSDLF